MFHILNHIRRLGIVELTCARTFYRAELRMEFKILFFNILTKSEGKGMSKAMSQSIKYTKVVNDSITNAP